MNIGITQFMRAIDREVGMTDDEILLVIRWAILRLKTPNGIKEAKRCADLAYNYEFGGKE